VFFDGSTLYFSSVWFDLFAHAFIECSRCFLRLSLKLDIEQSLPSNEIIAQLHNQIVMPDFSITDKYIFQRLKIKHLHLLVELADRHSVAEVAASMNVTQPAVSKTLAELESGLGVALFERVGRNIRPNANGECLIRHAREVLAGIRCAHDEMRALAGGVAGRVNIGMLSVAAPVLMPNAIRLLKNSWPGITVKLREGTMDQHLPELRAGKIDIIVGRLVKELRAADLAEEVLFNDPVVIVIAADHPLAKRRKLEWRDLNGLPWIMPPEGSPMHGRLHALLARHGVEAPTDVVESVSLLTNLPLLLSYPALGLLPESLARHHVAAKTLHILPLRVSPLLGPVGMIWSTNRPLAPAVKSLQQCLRAVSDTF
jgi:DNA-binding transcriptional LysR family regulator